jgi:hypothetical protein
MGFPYSQVDIGGKKRTSGHRQGLNWRTGGIGVPGMIEIGRVSALAIRGKDCHNQQAQGI